MGADAQTSPRPRLSARTVKSLADTKQHWITATAYDRTCARRADELATRDNWVMNVVLVLTTTSSLGVFGALVEHNPATWARVTVFVMTTAAAVLTAMRQQNNWSQTSSTLRMRGAEWNKQRCILGDHAERIIEGGSLTATERRRVDEGNSRLLRDHPPIPQRMYDAAARKAAEDFERIYEFT
ncbi:hypothetical protein [Nocardioides taihuensis]|uniref:SLATT domain-containing protein n=1 Tax=Nocardioides taihuensis TaxID=1835606 RepID=A0ABW0BGQ8_9ACTN